MPPTSDRAGSEKTNSGPDTELEFWRRRAQRLTSITEQLKTKACKLVIGVLQQVSVTTTTMPDRNVRTVVV